MRVSMVVSPRDTFGRRWFVSQWFTWTAPLLSTHGFSPSPTSESSLWICGILKRPAYALSPIFFCFFRTSAFSSGLEDDPNPIDSLATPWMLKPPSSVSFSTAMRLSLLGLCWEPVGNSASLNGSSLFKKNNKQHHLTILKFVLGLETWKDGRSGGKQVQVPPCDRNVQIDFCNDTPLNSMQK